MSKRLEGGYFALVLIVVIGVLAIGFVSITLSFSKGYKSADQEHSAYYSARDTTEKSYHECLDAASSLEGARECIQNTANTTRDSERAEQDLNAQREMAQWAVGMLWAAWTIGFLTLLATVIGVRYVFLTLVATQDSLALIRSEQRPWLHVEIGEITDFGFRFSGFTGDDTPEGVYMKVPVTIRNTGKIPAQSIMISVRAGDVPDSHGLLEETKARNFRVADWSKGAIAPSSETSEDIGVVRKFTKIHSGATDQFLCYIVVVITYGDGTDGGDVKFFTAQNHGVSFVLDGKKTFGLSYLAIEKGGGHLEAIQVGFGEMS